MRRLRLLRECQKQVRILIFCGSYFYYWGSTNLIIKGCLFKDNFGYFLRPLYMVRVAHLFGELSRCISLPKGGTANIMVAFNGE